MGGSRTTVAFLNNKLLVLEVTLVVKRNTLTKDGKVYRQSQSSQFMGQIEGSQTCVLSCVFFNLGLVCNLVLAVLTNLGRSGLLIN